MSRSAPTPAELSEEPVYDENGVDLSLIRYMLRLSPAERLDYLRACIELVQHARLLPHEPH